MAIRPQVARANNGPLLDEFMLSPLSIDKHALHKPWRVLINEAHYLHRQIQHYRIPCLLTQVFKRPHWAVSDGQSHYLNHRKIHQSGGQARLHLDLNRFLQVQIAYHPYRSFCIDFSAQEVEESMQMKI